VQDFFFFDAFFSFDLVQNVSQTTFNIHDYAPPSLISN
jgi:hypothetical protein